MAEIIERELSYQVNRCLYDVHRELGPGLREECYHQALAIELEDAQLPFVAKPQSRRDLIYLSQVADSFVPDFVVSNRILVELKALPEGLPKSAFRQTMNYLKVCELRLGMIVNFSEAYLNPNRVLFREITTAPDENYDAIRGRLTDDRRTILTVVREAVLAVHSEIGVGYSDGTYRNLLAIAFRDRGLQCDSDVVAHPSFHGLPLPTSPISPLLVHQTLLVQVEAVRDQITSRITRSLQTHLAATNLPFGIIVSFGQQSFTILAVKSPRSET